jgi:hypothetical protein
MLVKNIFIFISVLAISICIIISLALVEMFPQEQEKEQEQKGNKTNSNETKQPDSEPISEIPHEFTISLSKTSDRYLLKKHNVENIDFLVSEKFGKTPVDGASINVLVTYNETGEQHQFNDFTKDGLASMQFRLEEWGPVNVDITLSKPGFKPNSMMYNFTILGKPDIVKAPITNTSNLSNAIVKAPITNTSNLSKIPN